MHQMPVQVVVKDYPADSFMPPHCHDDYYLCHVERGSLVDMSSEGVRHLSSTTSFLRRPGEKHSNRFGPDETRCALVQFSGAWLDACGISLDAVDPRSELKRLRMARLLAIQEEKPSSEIGRALLQAAALELVAEILSVSGLKAPQDAYRELISAAMQGTEVLRDPCKWLEHRSLSRRAVDKRLRNEAGLSFSQLIRRERIQHALERIRGSNESLSKIAHDSGFADQPHMTREIKRYCGRTPGRIRKVQKG